MNLREVTTRASTLEATLRRLGIEGEDAFYLVAYYFVHRFPDIFSDPPRRVVERGRPILERLGQDLRLAVLLDEAATADRSGGHLPVLYQHFIGRRFRSGSGKFFTPHAIAAAMARLLPRTRGATIMDPTCGGGTFLAEASKWWKNTPCHLVGNDVEPTLVDLTQIVLQLETPSHHTKQFLETNIYEPNADFTKWHGSVDYILANPPFSLRIDVLHYSSRLFALGYRNSDALFLDTCHELLRPGGRLACLVPHSLIANSEFVQLREAVEEVWELRGVISLPEGVFHLAANASTRTDIIVLDKKPVRRSSKKAFFAYAPSVGFPLNGRRDQTEHNSLGDVVEEEEVRATLRTGTDHE